MQGLGQKSQRQRLLGPVTNKYGDFALLACCYVTGLLDAASFNNWGVFVGMQTGNTVILCLSTARIPASQPYAYATTSVSLVSFWVGAFLTTRISRYFGKDRRIVVSLDFLCQGLLIILAAALTTSSLVPKDDSSKNSVLDDIRIVTAIPPLAFQSGAQIATSSLLGYTELPVNVLTSTYARLAADPDLFAKDNVRRNRMVGAVVCLMSGAISSAWIMKEGPGIKLCLWLGAAVKIIVGIAMALFMESVPDVPL